MAGKTYLFGIVPAAATRVVYELTGGVAQEIKIRHVAREQVQRLRPIRALGMLLVVDDGKQRPGPPAPYRFRRAIRGSEIESVRGDVQLVIESAGPDSIDPEDANGETPLALTIQFRHEAAVEALLRAGADPNRRCDEFRGARPSKSS